jgi:hypothetical protein
LSAGRRQSFAAGLPMMSSGREIEVGGVVYCVRGGVAKLGGPSNRLIDRQRGREKRGTTHRGGRRWRRLFHELCSDEGGEEWPRPVRGRRGSGRPFYRRAREGERWSFAAPVSLHSVAHKCRTAPPMRHHGGAVPARTLVKGRGVGRSGAKLPCAARRQRRGRRRWPEVTAMKGRRGRRRSG